HDIDDAVVRLTFELSARQRRFGRLARRERSGPDTGARPSISQRRAERVKTRIDPAVSAVAKTTSTRRLSAAMAVASPIPQMWCRPLRSPSRPYRIRPSPCVSGRNFAIDVSPLGLALI